MARLIDADKLNEILKPILNEHGDMELAGRILYHVNFQPSVDAVEVVRGEWELIDSQHIEKVYLCTACENYEAWGEYEKTRYCPNCGAKMDGDKE